MESMNAYNEVAYPGHPYPQTHPDHLATLARLHGMTPAPADRCRVLDLGCGDGANVIPMALSLPESRFMGIDLAQAPILRGRELIAQLGLNNIRLEAMDLMHFMPEEGSFDYIIAHGLYSWVPPAVQEKIMEMITRALAPQGVAFVSYNTLPGGHIRTMMREMMLFHAGKFEEPAEKIRQALMLAQLAANAQNSPNRYGVLLRKEWEEDLSVRHPQALFHDELGDCNANLYFHEFIARASDFKLQFLCEAAFHEMQANGLKPQIKEMLSELGDDILAREQYLDFLIGRRFRQTLLCHSHVQVDRSMPAQRVMAFSIASSARPEIPVTGAIPAGDVKFLGAKDSCMTSTHPLLTAALLTLESHWPMPLNFDALWNIVREQSAAWEPDYALQPEHQPALAKALLNCFGLGLVELHSWTPPLCAEPGDKPLASPLARLQSLHGDVVTTLLHTSVKLSDALAKRLLQLLDGTKDRAAIVQWLVEAVISGQASLVVDQQECRDSATVEQNIRAELESRLQQLARLGLISN